MKTALVVEETEAGDKKRLAQGCKASMSAPGPAPRCLAPESHPLYDAILSPTINSL